MIFLSCTENLTQALLEYDMIEWKVVLQYLDPFKYLLTNSNYLKMIINVQVVILIAFYYLSSVHTKANKNIIMNSFKSSRDIQKKEGGPDSCFG